MGFMENLGRSNALGSVNSLMGKAIELRQQEDQGAERAYTLGMESEKLGMLKDEFELNMNKKKMENKRLQEEEAHAQFKTDVSTNPIMRQLPEAVRKDALEWGKQQGYWDENNIGSRRNQKRAYEELTSNKEVFNRFMWPTTQAHKANLEGAIAELNAEQEKDTPNPEKIAKIQQRVKGLQKIYDTATDGYSKGQEHFDKLEEIKAAKEAKAPTTRNRDVGDKQITEEWKDGAWVKVGEAPRWNERGGKREDRLAANQQFKNERDMRQDFEKLPEVKNFNETNIKAGQMAQAIEESKTTNNFVAVDQALITMFNKMTDPQSVVRESEYARTSNDIATVNMIKGKAQKVLTGGAGLTSAERDALKTMSDRFLAASKERYDSVAEEYRGLAKTYGYEPNNVVFRGTAKKGGGGVKTADEFFKKYGGK